MVSLTNEIVFPQLLNTFEDSNGREKNIEMFFFNVLPAF
jgi:hypothetical protein